MPNLIPSKLSLRLRRAGFRLLGPYAPYLTSYWAYRLWFSTQRSPNPVRESRWRDSACIDRIFSAGKQLVRYQWGEAQAPGILLIHGWNGRGLQLAAFAAPLVHAGLRVIAFDAPGHGDSPGNRTDIFEYAQAIQDVAAHSGILQGAIAHSFGVPAVAQALVQGFNLLRLVAIAAPVDTEFLVQRFAAHLDIPAPVIAAMRQRIERGFGMDIISRLSTERMLMGQTLPAIIIHDREDRDIPVAHAKRLQHSLPHAQLLITEGLGHSRILRDPNVIAAAVDFLRPQAER